MTRLRIGSGLAALVLLAFVAFTEVVKEGESAIMLRFGKPMRVLDDPGLHFKWPWPVEESAVIDMRRHNFHTRHTEMLTADKKNIILLSFAIWSVQDPLLFHQSVGSTTTAESKLDGLITNAKIGLLGKTDLSALASTNPELLAVDEIEDSLLALIKEPALEEYGIAIIDVGFNRLSLPKANVSAVLKQMRAERKQYAAKHLAEGEELATAIRSETDLKVAELESEAIEKAAKIKGESEARAAEIYGAAHGQDPDLYRFLRSLESLDTVLGPRSQVILRTDSEPFELLVQP